MAYERYPVREQRTNQPQTHTQEADPVGEVDQGQRPASRTRFYLDKRNSKVLGVCAGIADYTGFDVALVRVSFLAATVITCGWALLLYLVIAFVASTKPRELEYAGSEERQFWQGVRASPTRAARDLRSRLKDIDRRLADIESYVTTENRSLAREIDALALDKGGNA